MKVNKLIIALPSDGKELSQPFASVFGRCTNFVIIDSTNRSITNSFSNKGRNASGGAGIQAAQTLIDQEIDVVIAPRLGPNAWNVLKGAGIEVYSGISGTLQENVDAFITNKLSEMSMASESGRDRGLGRGRGLSRRRGRGRF
ncbi:MAG: NifB/NifX family molybdenum-iron cluster-binding protein [Candidatus Hodarchaeales archaeon]|jgi:predicted Fe-Mo cluster-binding NifX family protein